MKNMTIITVVMVVVAIISMGLPQTAQGITPYERVLGSNRGFVEGTKVLSLSSSAAVKLPPLPDGAHEAWVMSVNAVNYGDSRVSSETTELFVGSDTLMIFDKIISTNPEIYFIPRYESVATLTVQFR